MKPLLCAVILLIGVAGKSQQLPSFKPLRYDEDYSFLKNDTSKTGYKKLKFHSLSSNGNSYLSVGGEIRYQYFYFRNEAWGEAPVDKDGYFFSRLLAHADIHAGSNFRLFMQLQGSLANGKASGTSPVDENPLDLHQAFFDLSSSSKKAVLRAGRQELSYGSQRLVSVRELPNNRQAFDALRGIFSTRAARLDVFVSRYVTARKGIFDDLSNQGINFWGAYLVKNKIAFVKNFDLYYLGLIKDKAIFNDSSGKEERHSIGSRIWGKAKNWQWDVEGLYQFGDFTGKKISAWTLSSNTIYKINEWRLAPELGLKTEIISGDKQEGDHYLQTFNPLFPRGAYFGLAALIGPANLFDIHPSLSFELQKDQLEWTTDYDLFWRHSLNDGIYAPNVMLIYPAGGSKSRHIGKQLATDLTFTPNGFLMLRLEGTWFDAGPFLKDAGPGKDILFVGATAQLKF